MRSRVTLIGVGLTLLTVAALAQPPTEQPAFEVASIKPSRPTSEGPGGFGMPADRFEARDATLHDLIAFAYGTLGTPMQHLLDSQIAGEQPWMSVDRFDIAAKTASDVPVGTAGNAQKLLMLRRLLAQRFKLAVHHETRISSVYVLTLARADGKPGTELHRSDLDCQAIAAARGGAAPPPSAPGELPDCGAMLGVGPPGAMFRGRGQTMAGFAVWLSRMLNRPVLDHTGVAGAFNIEIRFDPQGLDGMPMPPTPAVPRPDTAPNPALSLFTVLQDQLGLKLVAERDPIDVIMVDRAEHPSED